MEKALWIVGEVQDQDSGSWDFVGVFDSEQKAIDNCTSEFHFVGPAILNERFAEERHTWIGGYYPNCRTEAKRNDNSDK